MRLYKGNQINDVGDEVSALIAIVGPILNSILLSIKQEAAIDAGGYENILLRQLPRIYRPGDGDVGIAFEWAVHDAIRNRNPLVLERIEDASRQCRLTGVDFTSMMFGIEKSGRTKIIDSVHAELTEESRLLTGAQAQPIKLKRYINMLASAFHRPDTRPELPSSINGLWKADLFIGTRDSDRWLGTTLKINPINLQGAKGLRIGIIPANHGRDDRIRRDDSKNLIICPLPYDRSFMEMFYSAWTVVQQFIAADANLPREVNLPRPVHRQVCGELVSRREFPIVDVVTALLPQAQPELLDTEEEEVNTTLNRNGQEVTNESMIAPIPRTTD